MLTSDRMGKVLGGGAEKFDWVIIDTPPVGLLPDAHLLASLVDDGASRGARRPDAARRSSSAPSRRSVASAFSASC